MKKIIFYTSIMSFLYFISPITIDASSNVPSQTNSSTFDQHKWDQLIKEAALVIPGQNTPAGLTDKQIVESLKTYVWPKYANLGPDDPKNVNYNKLMIDLNTFTKDIWSGKYCVSNTFPKTGPEITTLDNNWKKDEIIKKAAALHSQGWFSFRYPGEEKAVLGIVNQYQKLSEDERKKRMAYHDLTAMMLQGQFPYDKYPDFAIKGGYLKKFNTQ